MLLFVMIGIREVGNGANLNDLWISFLVFLLYKILGTHTAVDLIVINEEKKQLEFSYWLFYFYKTSIAISFEDLGYKNRNDILIFGGSMGLYFFKNEKLKIKINRRNGWKDRQIDLLIEQLIAIKEPLKPLKRRTSLFS